MTGPKKVMDLDECLIEALSFFKGKKLPPLPFKKYKRPLVVGSGNALVTGRILFEDEDVVFADEGNYQRKLKVKNIDGVVLISASGGKDAPSIARYLKKKKIRTVLLTNNLQAKAGKYVDKVYLFPARPEPYTYNISTYLGMILAKTKESPPKILSFLKKINILKNLGKYDAYYFIIPEKFETIREMFLTKFDELFGPKISGRVFTPSQSKHAKAVVPSEKELFISLGYDNKLFGKHRWNLPLPKGAGYGTMMALGYYLIGQIQKRHPPYFKRNIRSYLKRVSGFFGPE